MTPMMTMQQIIELPEEYEETRRLAEKIAKERISPGASERDLNRTFPWDTIRILAEAGLLGLIVSKDHGGFGGGRACFAYICAGNRQSRYALLVTGYRNNRKAGQVVQAGSILHISAP